MQRESCSSLSTDDDYDESAASSSQPGRRSRPGSMELIPSTAESPTAFVDGEVEVERQKRLLPTVEELMAAHNLDDVTAKISTSLKELHERMLRIDVEVAKYPTGAPGMLPFQVRRAKRKQAELDVERIVTANTIRKLNIISEQLTKVKALRRDIFENTKVELEEEIAALRARKEELAEPIRHGFIERINMLNRYWPWRQLLELGDTKVGLTFAEELHRGPRYRHVGIQSTVESDYIEEQLQWLQEFSSREEDFRRQVQQLDSLVEDLCDIDDLLQSTLTCSVCDLLFETPVMFWPCGHSFCRTCFESLRISPSLFRCPVCGSLGSEGFVHNLLLGETVAKWMFKDSGYGDLRSPINNMRIHLAQFQKAQVEERLKELRAVLKKSRTSNADDRTIQISYRAY